MAKEPDQTKWVGIRPTDPSEDIPTTTRKLAPAIGDLQAVKDTYHASEYGTNKNCSIHFIQSLSVVPDGEIWVVTNITAYNETSLCDILFRAWMDGTERRIKKFYSVEADVIVDWQGHIVLKEDDHIYCGYYLGGLLDTVRLQAIGYKIGVY